MMKTYSNQNIQEIPLSSPFFHAKVERFLEANGLRMEALDSYYTLENTDGDILAGAGLSRDVIKCIAVVPEARSEGFTAPLISHIIAVAASKGITCLKVFTKPENTGIFESLGFHVLAQAPQAVLMENGRGLEQYCAALRAVRRPGRGGVVVMNANPFTLGHRYLLEEALRQVDVLYVIPVKEDLSRFSYASRKAMIHSGAPEGVVLVDGSDYQISSTTFPTYFIKDLTDAAPNQMQLDLDLFARHIAPALGADVRYVGSEPSDPLTARYNELMKAVLPLEVVEIPRLEKTGIGAVSASKVREALCEGSFSKAQNLCPRTTWPYLLGDLAHRALLLELETPCKPGLVCPGSHGAHQDMDFALMKRALSALQAFWPRMAQACPVAELQQLGLEAEKAMLTETGGVNTHRGAIFSIGLVLHSFARIMEAAENECVENFFLSETEGGDFDWPLLMSEIRKTARAMSRESVRHREGVCGAREMAEGGYEPLFRDWLPQYKSFVKSSDNASHAEPVEESRLQKTLLFIMSTLDDTCVIHRVGMERAREVKREAGALLQNFSEAALEHMCEKYAAEGISPGGSADMLALTIFIQSIIN